MRKCDLRKLRIEIIDVKRENVNREMSSGEMISGK
jgi:hypothetical protein